MKILFILYLMSFALFASVLDLEKIEQRLETSHPLYQSLGEREALHDAHINAQYASSPFILSGSSAQARPKGENKAFEYSASIGKSFSLGKQRLQGLEIAEYEHKAHSLTFQNEIVGFLNTIRYAYHQACLTQEVRSIFEALYGDFETLYAKKYRAYQYKEISRKELLQLELEKAGLSQKLEALRAEEIISRTSLLDVVGDTEEILSCKDLYPLSYEANETALFSFSKQTYHNQIIAAQKNEQLYDRHFKTIDLSVEYDNEVDTKRYGVGFELPLSFTAQTDEYEKIGAIHAQRLLKLEQQDMLIEKNRHYHQLKARLKKNQNLIMMTKKNISTFNRELLPLIEKSYRFGESSVVEYLLSKQKLWQLQETLSRYKKEYYKTLFSLYTVAEIKEIK